MSKFFLAIIGGGPAGYTAAERASKAGKDVVLFEQNASMEPSSTITPLMPPNTV